MIASKWNLSRENCFCGLSELRKQERSKKRKENCSVQISIRILHHPVSEGIVS